MMDTTSSLGLQLQLQRLIPPGQVVPGPSHVSHLIPVPPVPLFFLFSFSILSSSNDAMPCDAMRCHAMMMAD